MKELIDNILEERLNKYSTVEVALGTNLRQAIEKARNAEMVVPVVGTQGMGKSTLINAILQENILPEGADETTCVPVEVRFGEKRFAEVYFNNGKAKAIVHTREELNEYVDNNYNHANEKQVVHIVLYRDNELLKKGLIIVDLPGLNSMTKENGETTTRYMENIGSAIILTSTIPTITQTESHFIKFLWKQFSSVIFVQNDWGETKQEIQESVEENKRVLSLIADEIKVPFDSNIHVINVRSALDGALQNNQQLIESSRISSLIKNLNDLVQNWSEVKSEYLTNRVKQALMTSITEIKKRLEEQNLAFEEVVRQRKENLNNHQDTTRQLIEKADEINRLLRQKADDIYKIAREKAKICTDNIQNQMYAAIDRGIYDGDNLERAFCETQRKYNTEYFDQMFYQFQAIEGDIKEQLEDLGDILQEKEVNLQNEKANHPRQIKWEQNLEILGGIAGSVLAYSSVGTALAAKIGVIAVANGWNPAGWVLAAISGTILIGSAVLSAVFGKKIVQNKRKKEAKRVVNEHIDSIGKKLRERVEQDYQHYSLSVQSALKTLITQRAEEERDIESKLYEKDPRDFLELNEDLAYFEQKEKELYHV